MRQISIKSVLCVTALLLTSLSSASELDKLVHYSKVINDTAQIIEEQFYSKQAGIKIARTLKQQEFASQFSNIKTKQKFALLFSSKLRHISGDNHIGIVYSPIDVLRYRAREQVADSHKAQQENDRNIAMRLKESKLANFGIQQLRVLEGNVGYIEMNYFDGFVEESAPAFKSAMDFLASTQAIILDLRRNGGGNSRILPLFLGYFLGPESVHFGNRIERWKNQKNKLYTKVDLQGGRHFDKPIYVLTSGTTFSLAEHVTYHLKAFNRATIIGERTYGGGKAFDPVVLSDDFYLRIPRIEMVNTVTNSMYKEGVGISPDVPTNAEAAFDTAYLLALTNLQVESKNTELIQYYQWVKRIVAAKLNKKTTSVDLPSLTQQHTFEEFKLEIRDQDMWMSFRGLPWVKLINLGNGFFYDDRSIQRQFEIRQINEKFELHVSGIRQKIRVIKES